VLKTKRDGLGHGRFVFWFIATTHPGSYGLHGGLAEAAWKPRERRVRHARRRVGFLALRRRPYSVCDVMRWKRLFADDSAKLNSLRLFAEIDSLLLSVLAAI
jgi:hypothetical protein